MRDREDKSVCGVQERKIPDSDSDQVVDIHASDRDKRLQNYHGRPEVL